MQPEQPLASPRTKVSLNPFGHFIEGNKNLFSTNAVPAILASVLTIVLSFAMSFLAVVFLIGSIGLTGFSSVSNSIANLVVRLLIFVVISILISGYFYEIVARTILTGTRREQVSFGSLFPFVAKRYVTAILAFLMICGVMLVALVVPVIGGQIHPAISVLIGIPAIIFLIIFALRVSYVPFIAVDDEKPQSARGILTRSSQLWKKSGGALILYFLTLIIISIVISVLTKSGSSSTSGLGGIQPPSSTFGGGSAIAYGSLIVAALIQGIFTLLMTAAIGNIYNEAKQIVDGNSSAPATPQSIVPAPMTPNTPMPTTPTEPTAAPLPPPTTPQPSTNIDPNTPPQPTHRVSGAA